MSDWDPPEGPPGPPESQPPAMGESLPTSGPGSRASIPSRAVARLVDLFIPFLAGGLLVTATGIIQIADDEVTTDSPVLVPLAFLVVWALYEVVGTASGGRTVGKMMMGLRVRRVDADVPPPPSKAFVRWLLPGITLLLPLGQFNLFVLMFIYLSAMTHPRQQGFHDRVANTLVVRTR